jgi:hypothetical protein
MQPRLEESLESASRSSVDPRRVFVKGRTVLKFVAAVTVGVIAYWNVLVVHRTSVYLPPRETEEIVSQEKRLAPVREYLLSIDYRGEIGFITNHILSGSPFNVEDDRKWGEFQYVMIPWVLVREKRNTPYVIADFSDGPPPVAFEGLSKVYDDGNGLILFRSNQTP